MFSNRKERKDAIARKKRAPLRTCGRRIGRAVFLAEAFPFLPVGAFFSNPQANMMNIPPTAQTIGLLVLSNVFMTFAWYGHLKNLSNRAWYVAALASWSIALFEYLLQVPANRIGHTTLSLGQLKILQEVISLSVFVPFTLLYMKESLSWNYLYAALCIAGAVFFIFRG